MEASIATPTPVLEGSDVEAPAFSDAFRFTDDAIAAAIVAEIDDETGKLRKALSTTRNAYARLGALMAKYRSVIVRPNGEPDWSGESDRYKSVAGKVLDTLVDGLSADEKRKERPSIQASVAYHTRKAVRSLIVAGVQADNPDADADTLLKLQEKALGRVERPQQARRSPTVPASNSPEDIEAANAAGRAKVARAIESLAVVSVVVQAEALLRSASTLLAAVISPEATEKGIVGREQAAEYVGRAHTVTLGIGKILSGKADEKDIERAKGAAILAAPSDEKSDENENDEKDS
jgi:hypothetical protein